MTVQAGLCQTCSKTTLLVFPRDGSYMYVCIRSFDATITFLSGFQFISCLYTNCKLRENKKNTRKLNRFLVNSIDREAINMSNSLLGSIHKSSMGWGRCLRACTRSYFSCIRIYYEHTKCICPRLLFAIYSVHLLLLLIFFSKRKKKKYF